MIARFTRALVRGIAPEFSADADLRRRALLTNVIALFLMASGAIVSVTLLFVAAPAVRWLAFTNTVVLCGLAGLAMAMIRRGRLVLAGNWIAGLMALGLWFAVIAGGGNGAAFAVGVPLPPLIALVISGRRSGVVWACLTAAFVLGLELLRHGGVTLRNLSPAETQSLAALATFVVVIVTVAIAVFSEDLKARAIRRVEEAAAQRDRAIAEEEKARIAAEQAIAANAAKDAFLATMSHELRTPLNAIIGYSEMVAEDLDERLGEHVESMQRIRASAEHLVQLISDILEVARLEADRLELRPEWFAIEPLIVDLAATFEPLANTRGDRITARCADDVGQVFLDRVRLRQILINLLGNAIKFTEGGVITLGARRRVSDRGDELVLTVQDTGIGIPAEKLDAIFESFMQVDSSFARLHEGSGLGLTIVRKLCALMGGAVDVSSELGVGTTLTVTLPAELPPPDDSMVHLHAST
ncbi:MAG: HAMP domain-containing sensor histidine kinase [Nannocystaceae bacterium]|nr:HAMP domain-containing histidine kinase [Myxococcales bacterium]